MDTSFDGSEFILAANAVVDVPAHIATCPYCGAALTARAEGWVERQGEWIAESIYVDCRSEPGQDNEEWREWFRIHTYMPYVYQLPVDTCILMWMQSQFTFDLG